MEDIVDIAYEIQQSLQLFETEFPMYVVYNCASRYILEHATVPKLCYEMWKKSFLLLDAQDEAMPELCKRFVDGLESKRSTTRRLCAECLAAAAFKKHEIKDLFASVKSGDLKLSLVHHYMNALVHG